MRGGGLLSAFAAGTTASGCPHSTTASDGRHVSLLSHHDTRFSCKEHPMPDEAREVIDISLTQIERTSPTVELQETRIKASVKPAT